MGRPWTVSIALPGSVLSLCRRDEQRVHIVSHIARALCVYSIDEIIIYDDSSPESRPRSVDTSSYTGDIDQCGYMDHLLQYLEMPPFMRKTLLPLHPNLKQAGLMANLEIPSHPHPRHWVPYAEGVTLPGATPSGKGTLVDIGHKSPVIINQDVPPKTRITLKLDENDPEAAEAVDPTLPRTEGGYFWGYTTRRAETLTAVFEGCKYEGGYDMSIGTSERGTLLAEALPERKLKREPLQFQHLLIVFGGPRGIEFAAENDPTLNGMGIVRARTQELFDHWVNFLPGQGTRTVQTEEALWAGLALMRRIWIEKE